MLILGQASCLVLGLLPNNNDDKSNAKEEKLKQSGLFAAYQHGDDPFRPMEIGVNVIERDPFTCLSYPQSLEPVIEEQEDQENVDEVQETAGIKRETEVEVVPFCKERLLIILNSVASVENP
jgi:hypothetical protein